MSTKSIFKLCKQTANSASASFLFDHVQRFNCLLQQRYHDKVQSMQLDTRLSISTDAKRDIAQTSGDKRLTTLRWTLNNIGLTRSTDQVIFHDQFTQACLPLLFGDEWNNHSVRIMQQENLTGISPEVLIMTPRRWGKSVSVSMFVLAMLLSCPGIRIAVFSTGRRASSNLMEMVMKYLKNIPDGESRIVKTNSEQLFISSAPLPEGLGPNSQAAKRLQTDPNTSVLLSFPCAIDGK